MKTLSQPAVLSAIHLKCGVLIYGRGRAGISDKHDVLFRNGFPCILKEYRFQNKENGYKAGAVTDLLGYRNAYSQNHRFGNRYFYRRTPMPLLMHNQP